MIDVQRDDAKKRLLWVARGEVTLAEVLDATARQVNEGLWTYSLLYDARERVGSLTLNEFQQLTNMVLEYWARLGPRGKIAILVPRTAYGVSRLYSLIGERLGRC
jgi:hypothetical protein